VTESAFSLERAAAADLEAILAISDESFAAPWSRASHADELARPGGVRWVARAAGRLAGYLFGRIQMDELEVLLLAVAPPSRRSGCGAALIDAALAEAGEFGVHQVHLEVRASAEPALACYRSAGFEVVGHRPGYYPDGEDAVLLSRRLAPQSPEAGCARTVLRSGECA